MTALNDWDEDGYEPDDDDMYDDDPYDDYDWDDRDLDDPEVAEAYKSYFEHCEKRHGGGECDCPPSLLTRLRWRVARDRRRLAGIRHSLSAFAREMHTARFGPLELTIRFRPRTCAACDGKGWFWTKGTADRQRMPAGHDGAALCGCGSAIARLADSRRAVRRISSEPPF